MCFDYDGYTEFQDERVVTAKKDHRCSECRATIVAGQEYQRISGKYDSGFHIHKICRRCAYDIVRVVEGELAEGCRWDESWPPLGGLVEHLCESDLSQTRPEDVPATFRVGDMPREPASGGR